jgi:hypothetical protein
VALSVTGAVRRVAASIVTMEVRAKAEFGSGAGLMRSMLLGAVEEILIIALHRCSVQSAQSEVNQGDPGRNRTRTHPKSRLSKKIV